MFFISFYFKNIHIITIKGDNMDIDKITEMAKKELSKENHSLLFYLEQFTEIHICKNMCEEETNDITVLYNEEHVKRFCCKDSYKNFDII